MGCGCSVPQPSLTEEQKQELFMEGAKQMMKQALVQAYHAKERQQGLEIKAPTEQMASIRKMAEDLKAYDAKEHIGELGGKVADKMDDAAGTATDMAGKLGGDTAKAAVGFFTGVASSVAGTVTEGVASGTGKVVDKVLSVVALALDEAINAIDKPFKEVGNDIFKKREVDIIKGYCEIIEDDRVKIGEAVKCVRGEKPYGYTEYTKCPSNQCVLTMQKQVTKDMQAKLGKIVEEEVKQHTVTHVWNSLIEKYNEAIAAIKDFESKYTILTGISGQPFKLNIEEYIVDQVIIQFYILMATQEARIRKSPMEFSPKTSLPNTFHLLFMHEANDPPYEQLKMEHWVDISGIDKFFQYKFAPMF